MFLIEEAYFKKRLEQRITRIRDFVQQPRRWILPWYFGYGLLGIISNGMLPVLLPLMVADYSHHLGWVGLVAGAFSMGSLSSIILGKLADRYHLHKQIYYGGLLVLLATCAVISLLAKLWFWMILSFAAGASIAAVSTVATLFVVEFNPQKEWEPRIGWLQTFYGAGQVVGLMLAGLFVANIGMGFFVSALLLLPAIWLGAKGIPAVKSSDFPISSILEKHPKMRDFHLLGSFGKLEKQSNPIHYPIQTLWNEIKKIGNLANSLFGRFLFSWFMLSFGIAAFFAYFPVVLRKSYNIPPTITSLAYGVSAGVSITLYIFGAKLAAKYGSGRVYRWGLIMRLIGFAIIFIIFFLPIPKIYFALAGFVCIVIAWPLISISATDLTARLSPSGEGTAMGLFNATAGIATVAGSFFSGPLIQFGGDASLSGVAIIGISVAWIFARGLDRKEIIKGR